MKTRLFKKFGAAIVVLTVILTMFALPASAAITDTSKANIIMNNAVSGDKFSIYKVVDTTYDQTTNSISYAFDDSVAGYFSSKTITIDDFKAYNATQLQSALSGLAAYIKTNSVAATQENVTAVDDGSGQQKGTVTFNGAAGNGLSMGSYYILPTQTSSVYQMMFQKVNPSVAAGSTEYELNNTTFAAKKEEVGVTKTADKTTASLGDTITYTVAVDVPQYDLAATFKKLSVTDSLPSGLTFVGITSIKKDVDGTQTDVTTDNTYCTVDTTVSNGFKVSVSNAQYTDSTWKVTGTVKMVITYTAKLNDSAVIGDGAKNPLNTTNTVSYKYHNNPYVDDETEKTTTNTVKTYGIYITKTDTDTATKLQYAKFELYKQDDTNGTAMSVQDGTTIKASRVTNAATGDKIAEVATNANGVAKFDELAEGTYYIKETYAPAGYNLITYLIPVKISKADNTVITDTTKDSYGYTETAVKDAKTTLPITGGTGTVIFTVVGGTIVILATVLFFAKKKKQNAAK